MKEELLNAAETLVQDRGFNAVSFQNLADAVGLSKPSVFHHFPNKEALALALIDRCSTKYGREYAAIIARNVSAPAKLRKIAAVFEQGLRTGHLCLLAALGSSVATLPETARNELHLTVRGAVGRFAEVFEQGRDEGSLAFTGSPEDTAMAFLASMEGLQILARAGDDHDSFARAAEAYIESLVT